MKHTFVENDQQLAELCRKLERAPRIAFDTEFVSEYSYRPELCLVQIAAGEELAVVDPLPIKDIRPLWEVLAAPGHQTIVHAGREELLFCHESVGKLPHDLFDVQLAAGFVGSEYPAGYGTLVEKFLGKDARKGETRTDWRRRPLSDLQLDYALEDVRHLGPLCDLLTDRLNKASRLPWLKDEIAAWERSVLASRGEEQWRRVSGSANLSRRLLAVVKALWQWREEEARRRNCSVKKVLRDDLIVELAKRRSSDVKQIAAIRGMERGDLRSAYSAMSARIEQAMKLPEEECPRQLPRESTPQFSIVGQLLACALANICRAARISPAIVGTAQDIRDLIHYRLGNERDRRGPIPALEQGWRAEMVGKLFDDLLAGKLSVRITDPLSDHPLIFEAESHSGIAGETPSASDRSRGKNSKRRE